MHRMTAPPTQTGDVLGEAGRVQLATASLVFLDVDRKVAGARGDACATPTEPRPPRFPPARGSGSGWGGGGDAPPRRGSRP